MNTIAEVTARGVVVTFAAERVCDADGSPDEGAIETELRGALKALEVTPEQLDVITWPETWTEDENGITKEKHLVQLFRWRPEIAGAMSSGATLERVLAAIAGAP